ncbi:MAG TPA: hypothetical protein VIC59_00440 [Gemmatimonadota bacterium]|jgi:hypothetical protein
MVEAALRWPSDEALLAPAGEGQDQPEEEQGFVCGRLYSLWEMLYIYARDLFELSRALEQMIQGLNKLDPQMPLPDSLQNTICNRFESFHASLSKLSLFISAHNIEDALASGLRAKPSVSAALVELAFLQRTLKNELTDRTLMVVEPNKKDYHETLEPFGPDVANSFPSCLDDAIRAARCLGFGQGTACVFHLARVMEFARGVVSKALKLTDHTPSWDAALHKIDEELKKRFKPGETWDAEESQFYATAAADLRAVQRAWRNRTMHIGPSYDDDAATAIYKAVSSFMQHLAVRLSE